MMFVLTTRNRQGAIQEFPFRLKTLEAGLDFISSLAARKETILSVYVVDKDNLTPLPVDAFDGSLLSTGIQQLQTEWQAVLARPHTRPVSADPWVQQRLEQNEAWAVQQQLMISSVGYLLTQLTELRIPEARKYALTQRYQAILATYERQLIRTYAMRTRLSRLG